MTIVCVDEWTKQTAKQFYHLFNIYLIIFITTNVYSNERAAKVMLKVDIVAETLVSPPYN